MMQMGRKRRRRRRKRVHITSHIYRNVATF